MGQQRKEDGEGPGRALALEDFGRLMILMIGKGYTSRYPESHRSRTTHVISNEILYYQRYLFV